MAELFSCPTCQTILRVPPNTAQVLCPKCQTILNIPQPPATPEPPPLPFAQTGQKAKAKPKPEAVKPKKKIAQVVDEQAEERERQQEQDQAELADKKRKMRADLAAIDRKEEREREKYKNLVRQCRYGRTGIEILSWGVKGQALAVGLQVLVMVVFIAAVIAATAGTVTGKTNSAELFGETFGVVLKVIVPLAMGISVLSILAMIVGMGYALAGPSKGWHVALLGMIVSVMHLGTAIIQGVLAIQLFIRSEFVIDAMSPLWKQAQPIFDLCGLITDIPLLSEHPARFMWRYNISVFGIVAGTLEFVRLVSISLLAQIYAEEGKAIETGHKALKSAYRAFWLLLLAGIFRVIAAYAFDWVRPDDSFMMFVGICTHGLITFSITMGLAMVLFFLAQTLEDVRDFVDPIRVASQGPIAEL